MDLEEWELLPDDGFLEINDDGGKKIFSRKYDPLPKNIFQMNYFICPSPKPQHFIDPPGNSRLPNQIVPVPIQLEPTNDKNPNHEIVKEITGIPVDISIVPLPVSDKTFNREKLDSDETLDPVSQVFFKKTKEAEFVDMKMDSPRSISRGVIPQIDANTFQFVDKSCVVFESKNCSSEMEIEKEMVTKNNLDSDIKEEVITWEERNGGLNLWKWSLTRIGTVCSFGVAAATICIIIFGNHQTNKKIQHNQKIRCEIYAYDKIRIKQVVHHATKFNALEFNPDV